MNKINWEGNRNKNIKKPKKTKTLVPLGKAWATGGVREAARGSRDHMGVL